jgi:hypothetical protein
MQRQRICLALLPRPLVHGLASVCFFRLRTCTRQCTALFVNSPQQGDNSDRKVRRLAAFDMNESAISVPCQQC